MAFLEPLVQFDGKLREPGQREFLLLFVSPQVFGERFELVGEGFQVVEHGLILLPEIPQILRAGVEVGWRG